MWVVNYQEDAYKEARGKTEMNFITDNIFIGDSQDAKNKQLLDELGITACLNCAEDLDYECPIEHYSKIGLVDGPCDQKDKLVQAIDELDILLEGGHRILVHCHCGVSRSVTVVATWIARKYEKSIYEALHEIARRRPKVGPRQALVFLAREVNNEI